MDIKGTGPSEQLLRSRIDSVRSPKDPTLTEKSSPKSSGEARPFSELLEQQLTGSSTKATTKPGELKFSAHAQTRLESRGINLSPDELVKLQEAVQKASEKGSRESLILTDKAAFIVSVKNNTVITAVDRGNMKENVFTNIDSTIMI